MIADILTYIGAYDSVRAACGLNSKELKDETLALDMYRFKLDIVLSKVTGIYTPVVTSETLVEIMERPLATTDPMYAAIQMYSVAVVSDEVMKTVGLRAYKTSSDGKATLTRFSPESTYHDVRSSIRDSLDFARREIGSLLGETLVDRELFTIVSPAVDLVTNS